ncbi:MAG: hypothetical protein M3R13_06880 [Armatimonadota bacterium]|nr:hypothetical protein [Armatimonadota bacterium]
MTQSFISAALTCVAIFTTSSAVAQGTGGGTIYYQGTGGMFAMNSSGGNVIALPAGVVGDPSRDLHGGARWFLFSGYIPGESYPDGSDRYELFAMRGDGSVTVQLTTQADLQVSQIGSAGWMPGDRVSFVGRRWLGGVVVEGGIYTVDVAYDGGGNITGLVAQAGGPAISTALVVDASGHLRPNMNFHDWSPDGQRVVYNDATNHELWVATLTNAHTRVFAGYWANTPVWSPANTKIAFMSGNGGISSISPDGTGLKEIIKRTPLYSFGNPHWSPSGSHLTYLGLRTSGGPQYDVFRSSATGSGKSNMTNTNYPVSEYPISWR